MGGGLYWLVALPCLALGAVLAVLARRYLS